MKTYEVILLNGLTRNIQAEAHELGACWLRFTSGGRIVACYSVTALIGFREL